MKHLNKKSFNYWIYLFVVVVLIFTAFDAYITYRIHSELAKVTAKPARWPIGAYVYDPNIGFDFAPNISGPIRGNDFYVKSHQLGYRIGEFDNSESFQTGGVLSLGCSFTYGDEVQAEQTFTQVMADSMHIPAYNYGVCSFSYAHALAKARNLEDNGTLDKLRPRYVILGCWKDLPNRSRTPFPRLATKSIPLAASYFKKEGNNVQLAFPLSSGSIFELVKLYRTKGPDWSFKKISKIFFSVPRFAYIFLKNSWLVRKMKDIKPNSQLSDYEVYDYYFSGIETIFSVYQTKILVLYMPMKPNDQPAPGLMKALATHPNIIFVDGRKAIDRYQVAVKQYKGKHPQAAAHHAYGMEAVLTLQNPEQK